MTTPPAATSGSCGGEREVLSTIYQISLREEAIREELPTLTQRRDRLIIQRDALNEEASDNKP